MILTREQLEQIDTTCPVEVMAQSTANAVMETALAYHDLRDACQRAESIEPSGSPEWVESGIAMRTTVLREVRAILDRERNAHQFGLSTRSAVAGNGEFAERAEQAEAAIARVRALCDEADRAAAMPDEPVVIYTDEVRAALDGGDDRG